MEAALGHALLTIWGALGFDAELMARYGPRVVDGLWTTLGLVAVSCTVGFLLALPLGVALVEGGRITRALCLAFSTFFRGTPLLAQVFLVYYGAGQFRDALDAVGLWGVFRDAWWCVVITFTLNTAAYQGEIIRGGVRSVARGQSEAAAALGLRRGQTYLTVTLPQALAQGLRPLGNELVLMIKASSIASVVTVYDVLGATKYAFSRSYDFEVYLWAALIYLVLVETVRRVWNLLERRATRHLRPREA
ncbi:ABC transporter permease [Methylopila sp. Yamaguchi]|uniref:ABC transporter permease n=1 Tax=Methylopila sp. Yamaguchi TaxID=1437817 RepID=UPI000CA8D3E8|nr:ABC transporter permease [Methylopila sp. Yamaguchi]GBD48211.1 polar amino acid ABC transporter inner membrane subunit [Methylopila sp. Yamaguchi]